MRHTAAVLVALFALPLLAQVRETQTVEVIEVPVYVTARDGSVITGLTRDNFDLQVNGKAQTIDYFDVIDFGAITDTNAEAPRDPRQRRLFLLMFDLLFAAPNSIHRAQDAAAKLIANAGDSDEFGVAKYTYNHGLEILVPFTRDRVVVKHAVLALRGTATGDVLRLESPANEIAEINAASPDGDLCDPNSACAELHRDRMRSLIDNEMTDLKSLAPRLTALEGQKHVVLLSDGFDPQYVTGAASRPRPTNVQQMTPSSITSKMTMTIGAPQSDARLLDNTKALHAAYGAAGVFLDAIDTAGLRPGGIAEENEGLVMMARDTGGDIVEKQNDLSHALQILTDRSRVVYILGFHAHGKERKDNSITVRLRNVGGRLDLRYRPTFSTAANTAARVDAVRLADILINDIPQNGIEVHTAVTNGTIAVTLPVASLLAQIQAHADVDALLYVFSGNSVVLAIEKRIAIDRERLAASQHGAIGFAEPLTLPPGSYEAKVVVTLDAGSVGFARQPFTLP